MRYLPLVALAVLVGCQTELVSTSDGRPMPPKPRVAPAVPAGTVPNRLLIIVGQRADDSDGNGYPDVIHVSAGLFAKPADLAYATDGDFFFELYRQGEYGSGEPIAVWRFDVDAARAQQCRKPWGTGYDFKLSLNAAGTDRMPSTAADLRGRFIPAATGEAVHASDEVRPIRVGR